jgi:Fic family protein
MAFNPILQPTAHLLKVLEEITSLKTRIQSAAVDVSWIPNIQKDSAARQTHGSTAIEGNPLTLPEIKILADGGELPSAKPRSVQEIMNYLAALRFIEKHAGAAQLRQQDVLKLHAIMGQQNALDRGPVGKFRNYQVKVGMYIPTQAKDVAKQINELLDWLNGPGKAWPAAVSSAILHYQFECIHPFGDGNGRVGRALATWELYRKNFDTHHIFAVDEVFLEDRQSYYRALHRVQVEGQDISGWVEYVAECVNEALGRTWKRIEAIRATTAGKPLTLTPKQERLLALLRDTPRGIQEILTLLKLTKPGAHYVLKPLLEAGLIRRTGGYRTGKYIAV